MKTKNIKKSNLQIQSNNLKFAIQSLAKKKIGKFSIRQISILLILLLTICLVIKGIFYLFDPARKIPDYSIVYRAIDGDLIVSSKDGKHSTKLASNTSSVVRYANSTNRNILYTKDDNLYLFDKNKGDKTKKIAENISNIFGFSKDDKYVYYLNNDNELYTYKGKKIKIDKEVEFVYGISDKYIIYQKNKAIYYAKLNGKGKEKITSELISESISDDGKKLIYITEDKDLYTYNIGDKRSKKIDTNVSRILDISDNYDTVIYAVDDNDIYFAKKDKKKKLVSNIDYLYYVNADDIKIVYVSEEKVYYQEEKGTAIEINVNKNISSAYLFKNDLYYTIYENEQYNLYYSKLGSKKASEPKIVLENVDDKLIKGYKKGLLVLSSRNGEVATLNLIKGDKAKKIAEDVLVSSITISHNKKTIYYISDYENKNNEGKLMKTSNVKGKILLDNVYNFNYIKDKLIYVQVNYSLNKTTDLKVIYKNKIKDIEDDIIEIYNVPVNVK